MRIKVIVNEVGDIVGFARATGGSAEQADGTVVKFDVVPQPGQTVHYMDVPDVENIAEIGVEELYRRASETLSPDYFS
jgi:hypothetical protein